MIDKHTGKTIRSPFNFFSIWDFVKLYLVVLLCTAATGSIFRLYDRYFIGKVEAGLHKSNCCECHRDNGSMSILLYPQKRTEFTR
jgi:hypothetical protein